MSDELDVWCSWCLKFSYEDAASRIWKKYAGAADWVFEPITRDDWTKYHDLKISHGLCPAHETHMRYMERFNEMQGGMG